jgi:hypothetical protein
VLCTNLNWDSINWKVLIGVATSDKFALHGGHRADNDFPVGIKALRSGYSPFIYISGNKSLILEL